MLLFKDSRNTLEVPSWLKRILKLLRTTLAIAWKWTAWKWIQSQEKQDLEADRFLMYKNLHPEISSVQSLSRVWLFATPWTAHARPPYPSQTPRDYSNSFPSSQWCHPTISSSIIPFSSCPQSFPAIRVFSNESALRMRWPKYWSFSFSISPSSEQPGLISFRMDWLDLLAVQQTLKSLLQHHSSKASNLRCSTFFRVQLSRPYRNTGETIALTRRTFVDKVVSLPFNMLSKYQNLIITTKFSIMWMSKYSSTIRIEFLPLPVVQMFIKQKIYIFWE